MNRPLVFRLLGSIALIEAACMVPSLILSLCCRESDAMAFVWSILLLLVIGLAIRAFVKPKDKNLNAREGIVVAATSWLQLSAFGALPFVFSGVIPDYVDAFFEAVSGFTTTGATIMTSIDGQPHGILFWRSFTHWIGGMGVLVLFLSLLPKLTGRTSHLMRAESPGPTLSKLMPKMGDTAKMLYVIYAVLTVIEFVVLMICGMNPFDAAIHAMGTAGTGGFSNYGSSIAAFNSPVIEIVITIFMILFGVNFALYYRLITGGWRDVLKNEELRWYLGICLASILIIAAAILPVYGDFWTSLRYSGFQVASIISTTGFATADYSLWPVAARMLIFVLMFVGSCAGSTAGGLKMIRVALMLKQGKREISRTFQPRKVTRVCFEGRGVDENMLHSIAVYTFVYILIVLLGSFLVGLEGKFDVETNLTAALTCVSNVGPGLGAIVGPAGNFAGYGPFAKIILSLLMLAGRLELFPILVLFAPQVWRRN